MREVTLEDVDHAIGLKKRRRVRIEPYGFLGRKTRETNLTAYTWTVDGQDLADWVEAHRQDSDPVSPVEETVWLADSPEYARDRISRLLGNSAPEFGPRTALLTCPGAATLAAAHSAPRLSSTPTRSNGETWAMTAAAEMTRRCCSTPPLSASLSIASSTFKRSARP